MRFTTKLKLGKRHRGAVRRFLFFVIHHKETGIGQELFSNSGKLLLVPYTKDFRRITRFWGNELATVPYAMFCLELHSSNSLLLQRYKNYLASNKNRIYFVSCQIILLMYFYNFPFTLSSIYNIGSNIAVFRDIILTKNRMMNVVITNKCKIRRIIPRTIFIF